MISSLGSQVSLLVAKEGKRPKEGHIVLEETFAHGRRSFWRKSMRLVS
jgi:hypothetical protein